MLVEYPLVCPFCDELSYRDKKKRQILLPHRKYTKMVCTLGHEFWTIEYAPEDQSAIVDEIKEISRDAREWRRKLKTFREGY